jgi:UDP-2,3-diacylglucosamine hydrolase
MTHPPVGLIAGAGRFPIVFAEKARELGVPVIGLGVADMAEKELIPLCAEFHWVRRLSLGFVIRKLKAAGASQWTMAGKYHKRILMQPWMWWRLLPDRRVFQFLFRRARDNKDDTILLALIAEMERDGLHCVSALDLLPELLVPEGTLTKRQPTEAEWNDIRFGWTLAKEMGRLDVGQSVMIRHRACIAVEAIEGTDACILRAGELCKRAGFTVVKVAKPNQDMRFDVPTVGLTTIENMHQAGAKCLALEAGQTIVLDQTEVIALANKYGIALVAMLEPTG